MNANPQTQFKNEPAVSQLVTVLRDHWFLSMLVVGIVIALTGAFLNQANFLAPNSRNLADHQIAQGAIVTDSIIPFLLQGLQLQLPSAGGNLVAIGLTLCYLVAPLSSVGLAAYESFFKRSN